MQWDDSKLFFGGRMVICWSAATGKFLFKMKNKMQPSNNYNVAYGFVGWKQRNPSDNSSHRKNVKVFGVTDLGIYIASHWLRRRHGKRFIWCLIQWDMRSAHHNLHIREVWQHAEYGTYWEELHYKAGDTMVDFIGLIIQLVESRQWKWSLTPNK